MKFEKPSEGWLGAIFCLWLLVGLVPCFGLKALVGLHAGRWAAVVWYSVPVAILLTVGFAFLARYLWRERPKRLKPTQELPDLGTSLAVDWKAYEQEVELALRNLQDAESVA